MEVEQRPKGGVVGEAEKRSDVLSRERLVELLNEDLAREYQAIIAYTIQEHQIDLATVLGEDVPDVSRPSKRAR